MKGVIVFGLFFVLVIGIFWFLEWALKSGDGRPGLSEFVNEDPCLHEESDYF